jgi:hypothetical protein
MCGSIMRIPFIVAPKKKQKKTWGQLREPFVKFKLLKKLRSHLT